MNWYTFLVILHVIGTALGVGAATVSDFLFLQIIKKRQIDKTGLEFLKAISLIVWTGFLILVFSGFGFLIFYRLTLPHLGLLYNPKLWAKLTIVLIIFFNGLILHSKIFPILQSRVGKPLLAPVFIKNLPLIFTAGTISAISWYSTLILGVWRGLKLAYLEILGIYFLVLLAGGLVANLFGQLLIKYLKNKP